MALHDPTGLPPLVTRAATPREGIANLTVGAVDAGVLGDVAGPGSWQYQRLVSVAAFWRRAGDGDIGALEHATRDLVAALHAHHAPVAMLVLAHRGEGEVLWGTPQEPESLPRLLEAHLPGMQVTPARAGEVREAVAPLLWSGITGVPTPKPGGLGRLAASLVSLDTPARVYAVTAHPLPEGTTRTNLEMLHEEMGRLKNTYLRRATVEEESRHDARAYLELLQLQAARYGEARDRGGWLVQCLVGAVSPVELRYVGSLVLGTLAGERSHPAPVRLHPDETPACFLSTPEVATLVRVPEEEFPGYQLRAAARFSVAMPETARAVPGADTIAVGQVLDRRRPTGQWVELPAVDLTRHALIVGTTGSGKTETCHFLLDQLWQEHGIPFLVIEPAKQEYRRLAAWRGFREGGFRLFTLGSGEQSSFRLNPLEVPDGVPVQTHLDLLLNLFQATFAGLHAPLPYLLEEALYRCYAERGWDPAGGRSPLPAPDCFPTLGDLSRVAASLVEEAGYDPEVSQNVGTALLVRLNSLRLGAKGRLLDHREPMRMETLLDSPAVLELAALGDPETVSFVMGLLWLRLFEHRRAGAEGPSGGGPTLHHLLVLEEAHRLLGREPLTSGIPDGPTIRGRAVETFCNLLAEVRALGQGLMIVEQSPAKLQPDVLRNTNLKVVHRLVAREDRESAAGCTVMDEAQARALATLSVGQAAVFAEGMDMPCLARVPHVRPYAAVPPLERRRV